MQQIVLLGASNLTSGFPVAARLATAGRGPGPFRLLAAAGHGRAYAAASMVLGRGMPPIAGCALWRELAREPGLPTRALVADAGNDLAYGVGLADTVTAIRGCVERLAAAGAETVVVLPPIESIERLSPGRFLLLRSLIFPRHRFELAPILGDLRRLAAELRRLAAETGAEVAELDPDWFGPDRIHLRPARREEAWGRILAGAAPAPVDAAAGGGLPRRVRWRFLAADRARLLGVPLRHRQPARRLADGSTVSFY
jgi:hypothetical protein